ncbi:hypothetical protein PanWU01x14_244270, partial [Parasponia andersonii]
MADEILGHYDLFSFHKKYDKNEFSGSVIKSTSNSSNLRNPSISFAKVIGNFNANSLNDSSKMLNGFIDGLKSPLIDRSNDVAIVSQPTLKGNYLCVKVNKKVLRDS